MATHRDVLTDLSAGFHLDEYQLSASRDWKLAGANDWVVAKRTLRGGVSEGVDVVELNNGALAVSILPTRGMGLWKGNFRDIEIGWKSPVLFPVNPMFVDQQARNGLGWLAGFNELMCRCGLSSHGAPGLDVQIDAKGNRTETPLTLHGKIANIPAHYVAVDVDTAGPGTLAVTGVVDEASLFGPRLRLTAKVSTTAGSNEITIADEVTNLGGGAAELELLYHTNLGPPFLGEGSELIAPVKELAPRDDWAAEGLGHWQVFTGPSPGYREQCYFVEAAHDASGNTAMLLKAAGGKLGLSVRYNVRQLPHFTLWKNTQAAEDGYCTGLEPGTSFPNLKTFERERGRVISLAPGETYRAEWSLAVHDSAESVAQVEREIAQIQATCQPELHAKPQAKFSPA